MKNNIIIPKFLHDVLGEKSNWLDIILIQVIAIFTVIVVWVLSFDFMFKKWEIFILLLLAYDIGGGVIANFSSSTNLFYEKNNKKRIIFICVHILQPVLLAIVFNDSLFLIIAFSAYTLITSFIVNSIQVFQSQLSVSIFFTLTGILYLFISSDYISNILLLLMMLFVIKLPFAFSVRWYMRKS